ncbi:MAG: hypothetical protein GY725_19475 [bacterium]|nr:hypothetical protein [bacterium]
MEIEYRPKTLQRILVRTILFLTICGLMAEIADEGLHLSDTYGLQDFFSLSDEGNLPTWFSSLVLFSCGITLALIAMGKRQANARYVAHWWVLCAAFLYISLDEFVTLHEDLNALFRFDASFLYFGWVIPAGAIVAAFGLSYLGFLGHLPVRTRTRFIQAGALFVGGALGVELILGYWTDRAGDQNLVYGLIDLVEESMEMMGSSLFFYTLVGVLAEPTGTVSISISNARSEPDSE